MDRGRETMFRQSTLVVTPLQKEYDDLHHSLTALGSTPKRGRIGKLDVAYFPALHVTLARGGHGKTQFGIQTQHLFTNLIWLFVPAQQVRWHRKSVSGI